MTAPPLPPYPHEKPALCTVDCFVGRPFAGASPGPGSSLAHRQALALGDPVSGRRRHRHHRPHAGAEAVSFTGPAGGGRQQARRRWQHRVGHRGQGSGGWLHPLAGHQFHPFDRPRAEPAPALRRLQGLCTRGACGQCAQRAGGGAELSGRQRQGTGGAAEEEPGPIQLWLQWHRHLSAPDRRNVQVARRRAVCRSHPLPRHRPGDDRPDRRADRFPDGQRGLGATAHRGGPGAAAGGQWCQAFAFAAPGAHPDRAGCAGYGIWQLVRLFCAGRHASRRRGAPEPRTQRHRALARNDRAAGKNRRRARGQHARAVCQDLPRRVRQLEAGHPTRQHPG